MAHGDGYADKPIMDRNLLDVRQLLLDRLLSSDDTVLMNAVRRVVRETDGRESYTGFANTP